MKPKNQKASSLNPKLATKLKSLPISPGVYFHKDKTGEIIYVGKAAVLKNRVRQYFQNSRDFDNKTKSLVSEIQDTDWVETDSEIDALFLEAEMVKRYMPKFNVLLRDDKSLIYVRIDTKSHWPHVSFTRHPLDDGADYYGPYYNAFAIKKAMRFLRRVFPYYTRPHKDGDRLSLDEHLGLSPNNMSSAEYQANLRQLVSYITGSRQKILNAIEKDMVIAAKKHDFERAAILRNQLHNLRELKRQIMFGDKEFLDISKDEALSDLTELLMLEKLPIRIEGYDISHMSGTDVVASQVVFKNGVSDRSEYRKYKTKIDRNNDFANMHETITRRFSPSNIQKWGLPNLVLIDGGKGQLDAAISARDKMGQQAVPFIGLAKKQEQIILKNRNFNDNIVMRLNGDVVYSHDFTTINLPNSSHIIKLLQRIRDESHRFAVSYHTTLKNNRQTASFIDEIPGIGLKTKTKLMRHFGSFKRIKNASEDDLSQIVGASKAKILKKYLLKID